MNQFDNLEIYMNVEIHIKITLIKVLYTSLLSSQSLCCDTITLYLIFGVSSNGRED